MIQKDTCNAVFIAVLFTIAKIWKQPKCPPTEEWIKKMWYIYTVDYYSAIKRNEIGSFVETWVDLETVRQSEERKREGQDRGREFGLVQFSCSVVSDSLQPHGLQHTSPLCPSPAPGVYSNSCPLSR